MRGAKECPPLPKMETFLAMYLVNTTSHKNEIFAFKKKVNQLEKIYSIAKKELNEAFLGIVFGYAHYANH